MNDEKLMPYGEFFEKLKDYLQLYHVLNSF